MNIKKLNGLIILGASILSCASVAFADEGEGNGRFSQQQVLRITGTGSFYPCEVPATDRGTTSAFCVDADITDLKTGEVVGKFTDALNDQDNTPDGGFVITSTARFRLLGGELLSRARVSVIPVTDDYRNFGGALYRTTHVTAGIPTPGEGNNIIEATGRFKGATGQTRVSGAINLSDPNSEGFNCLFLLDLNLPRKK